MIQIQERVHQIYQPTLETIRMVESFIEEHSGEYKRKALWKHLPKKMMYQTFKNTIQYLLESNKIVVDKEGHIVWIWDPEIARKYLLKKYLTIE